MDVAKPKPVASPSANMTSKFVIGVIFYRRSPIFPIFFFAVAASASPSQLAIIFNVGKSGSIFFFFLTTGDNELMGITTNQRENPNVKDVPRLYPARPVRQQRA